MTTFQAIWKGGAFHPFRRYHSALAAELGDGEVVTLKRREERSSASHNHYFAAIESAWQSLPEDQAERWPSADHLRRWALIKAGYHDERSIVCASKAEAQRVAAFVKPMDPYAVVVVREAVVTVLVAQSQSLKAMDRKTFQESKVATLDVLAELIGVDPAQFQSTGRDSAAPNKRAEAAANV